MTRAVRVLATGGTIASTGETNGARPTVGADQLVADVTDVDADVSVEEIASLLSFQIDTQTMATMARRVTAAVEEGADGVVITHGTDHMAESAFYLDLVLPDRVPVVFTGAQRRPDEPSPDGPANLRTALTAATHPRVRDAGGIYVAFNESLHAARDVRKVHSHRVDGFASPGSGPVASFGPAGVRFHRSPGSDSPHVSTVETDAWVPVLSSYAGASGQLVEAAFAEGADALVLEGSGLGNLAPGMASAMTPGLEAGTPVVLTTRCPAGSVAPVYGTKGGGRSLAENGALFAGDLPAHKARIAVMLGLAGDRPLARYLEELARAGSHDGGQ